MNTSGGFLFDANQGGIEAGPSHSSRQDGTQHLDDEESESITIRKLTSKQETRLMNYLDEAFLQINRGFNKRHNSSSSSVPTLDAFIRAYDSILTIIASIPPLGPSASLLVSYLLRYTNELLVGISGYEISSQQGIENDAAVQKDRIDEDEERKRTLEEQLRLVIQSLGLLDRVWSCILRGQMVDLKTAKKNVESNDQTFDNYFPMSNGVNEVEGDEFAQGAKATSSVPGRFPPFQTSKKHKEGRSFVGSKGYSTVAQTNRIRLRNVITLAKEDLFTWMRVQLDVPLPPRVDPDDEEGTEELIGRQGDQDTIVKVKREEGEGNDRKDELDADLENELEEVDTDQRLEANARDYEDDQRGDHSHFQDLFARKIDPDAIDSDEEQESPSKKHSRSPSSSASPRQMRRLQSETSADVISPIPDTESIATFPSGTASVMKWDLKFARLFAHTLRCLSDIQEHSNHRESASSNKK